MFIRFSEEPFKKIASSESKRRGTHDTVLSSSSV
jgi:hypothetical protein